MGSVLIVNFVAFDDTTDKRSNGALHLRFCHRPFNSDAQSESLLNRIQYLVCRQSVPHAQGMLHRLDLEGKGKRLIGTVQLSVKVMCARLRS